MKLWTSKSSIPLAAVIVAMAAAEPAAAQGYIVHSRNGVAGVYTSSGGSGVAGTFDGDGFHGVAIGPDGRVRRLTRGATDNPFQTGTTPPGGRSQRRSAAAAVAGAATRWPATSPGGFDPIAFVLGQHNSAGSGFGVGVFAGDAADARAIRQAQREFRRGHYDDALEDVNRAVSAFPGDVQVEQLRGLILFALGKYDRAAEVAYTALDADARWDWPRLSRFYRDKATYVRQFRALEAAAGSAPESAGTQFLLAYHYLMLNQGEMARQTLERTAQLLPNDRLVGRLLRQLPPAITPEATPEDQ